MAVVPLAERMRPQNLVEFVGQKHLLGEGRFLASLIQKKLPFPRCFSGARPAVEKQLSHDF